VFKKNRSSKQALVGLELDPSHIAAAEVSVNGSVRVTRGAVSALRPGLLRDGEVADGPALADALRSLFAEHELSPRVRLGIANQRIVVRTLDVPVHLDTDSLEAAVREQVPDTIPMPMDEAVMDWHLLGEVATPQGPRSRVIVVAVRRESVERLASVVADAGLQLEGVDLSAFGMIRALQVPDDGAVVYIGVAGLTNIAVANASGCLFTRAAAGGLDAMAHQLADRRALTLEHAHQWMRHVGLTAPLAEIEGESDLVGTTRSVLADGAHQLADTVRNSLNFYATQDGAESVKRGLLTGPVVAIPGITTTLSEHLGMPIELATIVAEQDGTNVGSLTVAAGLALDAGV
jgi:type IV pilus assembly protein PilM